MIEPAIDKMSEMVGNKYKLTALVAKRAKQIQKRNIREDYDPKMKEITEAANEVMQGKLVVDED
ncbi:MAG: DNA-directed RNA polymerase subunit omega [Clostridia bacterium]|nr:DNA-directed RNA polymerase subunit omega [Clostridia bacterium]